LEYLIREFGKGTSYRRNTVARTCEEAVDKLDIVYNPDHRVIHTCLVCSGKGLVAHGFYGWQAIGSGTFSDSMFEPEQCRSCRGKGYVWEEVG
jgi:hypothetical protein